MGDEEGSVDGYGGTALFVFIPQLHPVHSL